MTLILQTPLRVGLLVCCLLPSTLEADPGGKLSPCKDAFSEPSTCYHDVVRRALLPGRTLWERNPLLRIVALPAFGGEWVVSVYESGDSAEIELRFIESSIEDPEMESRKGYCQDPAGLSARVRVASRFSSIEPALATSLRSFWEDELLELGPPTERLGFDGAVYHASAWVPGYGLLCGQAWSPDDGPARTMVEIAHALRALALDDSTRSIQENAIQELLLHATSGEVRGQGEGQVGNRCQVDQVPRD